MQEREKTRREAEKAEVKRRDEEEKRRTEERSSREEKLKDKMLKMEKVKKLMEQVGEKPFEGLTEEELLEMEEEDLLARGIEHMSKEKDDLKQKMKQVEKRLDYFTRAQRLVEIPLLNEEWEKTQQDDKVWWEKKEADRIEMAIKKREHDICTRRRLLRMRDDKDEFVETTLSEKEQQYEREVELFEIELQEIREERREAKKEEILKTLTEKREKEILAKEAEEKKRQKEEELRRFKEEKAISDKEAIEAKEKREAREKEIEEKKREREQQQERPSYGAPRGAWGRDGGDRDRGDRDRGGDRDRDRDRGGDRDRDRGGDRDEGGWRRAAPRNESPPARTGYNARRDDSRRDDTRRDDTRRDDSRRDDRDEFRRDRDMRREEPTRDEPTRDEQPPSEPMPQRKRLNLTARTKPIEKPLPQSRKEPVGGVPAQDRDVSARTTPEGRDVERPSPRARGDGQEQDGFTVVTKPSTKRTAYVPPSRR